LEARGPTPNTIANAVSLPGHPATSATRLSGDIAGDSAGRQITFGEQKLQARRNSFHIKFQMLK
jgi:hypothetical protein